LRAAANLEELTKVLVDSTLPFCGRAAIFTVEDSLLHGAEIRGVEAQSVIENFSCLRIPLTQAKALANCVESNDTVVALNSPTEVSGAMVQIFDDAEKVYLFPITASERTVAILYAVGQARGLPVEVPSLESLAQTAGARWEHLGTAAEPAFAMAGATRSELVTIRGAGVAARVIEKAKTEPVWPAFLREERELHLSARRFARVKVAEMHLHSAEIVRSGRARHDIYAALQPEIDSVRESFRQKFVTASRSMIDYFHSELLHSLANDDISLLGRNYPGPLV
jgi:hypothetical protein